MEELSHSQKLVGKLQISFCNMWEISCSYTSRWWYYLFFVNSLPDYFQSQQQGVAVEQWNPPTVCDFTPKSQIFGVIQLILDSVTIWIWVKLGTDAKEVSDLYLVQPHYKLSTTYQGKLWVSTNATFQGELWVSNNATFQGELWVSICASSQGELWVSTNITFGGNFECLLM